MTYDYNYNNYNSQENPGNRNEAMSNNNEGLTPEHYKSYLGAKVRLMEEADNVMYFALAVGLILLSGYGEMAPAGSKLADMLLGALLMKVKA